MILLVFIVLLITAAAVCGYFFMREYNIAQQEISEYNDIQSGYTTQRHTPIRTDNNNENTSPLEPEEAPGLILPYLDIDFETLLRINPDTVGWIAIPDTVISYPVVQVTNNTKYLNLSFQGVQSKTGTPFVDYRNNMESLDHNTIIYGHNMGTGRMDMFSTLLLYKDYEYFSANRYIQFDTIHHLHGFWKVFAVIELDASNTEFQYLQISFHNSNELNDCFRSRC
jgi:sortase B